jgi:glutamate dehydrogenase (NAD(P)+)
MAVLREAMDRLAMRPESTTASIQGFGKVAQHAARRFVDMGGTLVAVAAWDPKAQVAYTFQKTQGIDPTELSRLTDTLGTIDRSAAADRGYDILPGSSWLEQEVDVLIPAALEHQITAENAPRVHGRVRVVVEAANSPTMPDASRLLEERGVVVIPDVLANAGGVTCSYFEQVQGQSNYYWQRADVLHKVDARLAASFAEVQQRAEDKQASLRDGAYLIAIERVAHACRERGWV